MGNYAIGGGVEAYYERSLYVLNTLSQGYKLCFMSLPLLRKSPSEIQDQSQGMRKEIP